MPDDQKPYDPEDDKPLTDRQRQIVDKYHAGVRDHELYELANPLIDRDGAGTGLNLLVGGCIVSGKVCSAYEWANALDDLSRRLTGKPRQEFEETSTFQNWSLDFIGLRQARDEAWNSQAANSPMQITKQDSIISTTSISWMRMCSWAQPQLRQTASPTGSESTKYRHGLWAPFQESPEELMAPHTRGQPRDICAITKAVNSVKSNG